MIIEQIKKIKSDKNELRKFGILIGTIIGLIFLILIISRKNDIHIGFMIIPSFFVLAGIFMPIILMPIQKIWMAISIIIGAIISFCVLLIFYFTVFTLIGIISRTFSSVNLDNKIEKQKISYWHKRDEKSMNIENYKKQY